MDIQVFSRAKINLTLNVFDVVNGYHNIRSIVTSVNMGDYINISRRKDSTVNITFLSVGKDITSTVGQRSSVFVTIEKLRELKLLNCGLDITVDKHVPIAGGMGGSSVDAAGTLNALDKLLDLSKKGIDLVEIAAMLGSDTPFMLEGGTAIINGRGQIIQKIENNLKLYMVVACGNLGSGICTSKAVYQRFDTLKDKPLHDNNDLITDMLKKGDTNAINYFYNELTNAAVSLDGGIEQARKDLLSQGAVNAVMTGSGNCVIGYYSSGNEAQSAAEALRAKGYYTAYLWG